MKKIIGILANIIITGLLATRCTLETARNVASAETTPARQTQSIRVDTKSRR
jgi:hypothetical protein